MNKSIFKQLLKKQPETKREKYIFLNDNKSICEAIITVGFLALYIAPEKNEVFHDADSFVECIKDTVNTGSHLPEYVFVLGCYRKRTNDQAEYTLKSNLLEYKVGAYTLFRDKEYLGNYDRQDELEKVLADYVERYEGPHEVQTDKEQFLRYDHNGKEKGIIEKSVVDYIIETVHFFVANKTPYLYSGGVYTEDLEGIEMKAIIQNLLYDRHISYRTVNGIYRLLIEQRDVQRNFESLNDYPAHWINFKNGLFDTKEMKLHKHHPKYLAINQIPHDLDLSVRNNLDELGKEMERFLSKAIPDLTDQTMLYQYIGYCMTRDTCMQKFLIIKGPGGTGKSSIISVIQNIVGLQNISGISLQDLNQRFYPAQLRGKLLNACADIPSDSLSSVDVIKKATGEDLLMYELKSIDATTFRSYAKLLFSANQIPLNLDEKSDALYRRMMILVMDKKPDRIDLELDSKLKAESQYIIWRSIAALRMLYKDGRFCESSSSREEVEKLHRAADTVKAFMDECTVKEPNTDIKRSLLYEKYCEYCTGYGRKPHGPNSFYRNIEDKGYILKNRSNGRFVLGISLKSEDFITMEPEDKAPFSEQMTL